MVYLVLSMRRAALVAWCVVCLVGGSYADAVGGGASEPPRVIAPIRSVRQLHAAYGAIFKTRNRNAASHLWMTHVLERAPTMTRAEVDGALAGFCAVSGSPVNPHDYNRKACP